MKNQGFTLIELIGTIVILSLLLLILIPNVSNSLKEESEKADQQTIDSIIMAAKNWSSEHKGNSSVSINSLMSDGYLEKGFKLPSTTTDINLACVIITEKNPTGVKKAYSFEYRDDCS